MALGQCPGHDDEEDEAPEALPVTTAWERPKLAPDAQALETRVKVLGLRLATWRPPDGTTDEEPVRDALEVLGHYGIFIGAKVHRALFGLAIAGGPTVQSDANGSAKAALLAFDRLGDAWLKLVERGAVGVASAEPMLTDLAWVTGETERLFPQARHFVRPGLDEPHAVAMLEWQERG
jgi:putative heme degradation protein